MKEAEYNKVVSECADALYRFSHKLTREDDFSCDLVQDCFLKLWEYKGHIKNPKSFLFSILYHLFLDDTRRKNVQNKYEIEIKRNVCCEPYEIDKQIDRMEKKEQLDVALEALPEIQKSVVLLRDYEGYTYEEIGEITGLNEAQVKTYIFRARVNLKKTLQIKQDER